MGISQKVQSIALNESPEFTGRSVFRNILRSMEIAILNFFRDMLFTGLIILIAIVITWLAPVAPFAIFFAESYFFGYAMTDYRNQFLRISVKDSRKIIHNNIGLVIGNGICFNMILLVPLVGIIFAPVLALIAAGISIDEVEKNNK
jgi:CysZ protein